MDMSKIGWSSYSGYEGPYYWGTHRYVPPKNPNFNQKCMSVLSATEGCLDAVNMYDRCIISVGAIQWCEAGMFGVTRMLAFVEDKAGISVDALVKTVNPSAGYKTGALGQKAFFLNGVQVQPGEMQRRLFLLNSSGAIGCWDAESKTYAKKWVALMADIFSNPAAQDAQLAYTMSKMKGFVMPEVGASLFNEALTGAWIDAARVAYISFAANLPAVAAKMYKAHVEREGAPTSDNMNWVVGLLRRLTFGPGIRIYPDRFNKIRPIIEKMCGVDLPDFAVDLEAIEDVHGPISDKNITTPIGVQKALMVLGYDIGPCGADGLMWSWQQDAIQQFQQDHGLVLTGYVDDATHAKMHELIEAKGLTL